MLARALNVYLSTAENSPRQMYYLFMFKKQLYKNKYNACLLQGLIQPFKLQIKRNNVVYYLSHFLY